MSDVQKALYRPKEAAAYIGVKVHYLRYRVDIRPLELPGHGPNKRPLLRYRKTELDKWLSEHPDRRGRAIGAVERAA